ncbi:DUF1353 domain-containing protein [Brevundimonas sp.]|uniref:DUF1353 domain-containing protein n=1 Tax=Brevundimonas sp. TaxID=1871086 RepID=UPI002FC97A71
MAIVASDYLYHDPATLCVYLVPSGYITDFASIPWPASMLLPPFGLWTEGSVVHDFLYAVGESGARQIADRILHTAIREQGVGGITAGVIHLAVKVFGGRAYGAKEEWSDRFGDLASGQSAPPPFARPASAVVARGVSAADFEQPGTRQRILEDYWSRPSTADAENAQPGTEMLARPVQASAFHST